MHLVSNDPQALDGGLDAHLLRGADPPGRSKELEGAGPSEGDESDVGMS